MNTLHFKVELSQQREKAEATLQPLPSIWKPFRKSGRFGKERFQQENGKSILRQDRIAENGQTQFYVEKVQLEANTSESRNYPARDNGNDQLLIEEVQLDTVAPKLREISASNDEEDVDLEFDFSPLRSRTIGDVAAYPPATMRTSYLSMTSNSPIQPRLKNTTPRSREHHHRRSTSLPVDYATSIVTFTALQSSLEQQTDTITTARSVTATRAKGPLPFAVSLARTPASTSVPPPEKPKETRMLAGVSGVKLNSCGPRDIRLPLDRAQARSTAKASALTSLPPAEMQNEIQKLVQTETQPSWNCDIEAAPTDQMHHTPIPTSSISPSYLVSDKKAEISPALSAVLTFARHNAHQAPLPSGSSTSEPSARECEARRSASDKQTQSLPLSGPSSIKGTCDLSVRNKQNQPLPAAATSDLEFASNVSALNKPNVSLPKTNLKRSFIAFSDNKPQPGFATTSTPPDIRRRRLASSGISNIGTLQAKDKNRKITGGTAFGGVGKGLEDEDMVTKPKAQLGVTSASMMYRRRLANVCRDLECREDGLNERNAKRGCALVAATLALV